MTPQAWLALRIGCVVGALMGYFFGMYIERSSQPQRPADSAAVSE